MRKHFLLLFLMALLPLAGWAEGELAVGGHEVYAIKAIANGDMVYNKSDYSQTAWQIKYQIAENGAWLDLTSGYEVSYYPSTEGTAAEIDDPIVDAGDYYISIKAANQSTTCTGTLPAAKRFKFTIAQAPLNITIADGVKNYGDATPDWQWEVAEGTQFAPGDNKTNVAINIVATAQEGDNLNWGGTHHYASVTATEANGNYKVTVVNAADVTLTVNKAKLIFKVGPAYGDNGYLFTKDYYSLEESLKVAYEGNVTFTGARGGDIITPVLPTDGKVSYTYELATDRTAAANATTAGVLFDTDDEHAYDGYKITFSGISLSANDAKNYDIDYENRIVVVKQIAIVPTATNAKFVYTPGEIDFTYTGAKQEPTAHAITYQWGDNATKKITLTKGVDYDFAYTLGGNAADPINATDDPTTVDVEAKYAVKVIAATGTGSKKNFTVAEGGVAIASFDFPIKKKQLDILVNPKSKEYNATVQTFDKAYTINGWVNADASKTVTGLDVEPVPTEVADENTVKAAAGKYYQQVKISDNSKLTWTEGETAKEQLITLNYWVNKLTAGYFEVTPKAMSVTVKANKTITFGAALPTDETLNTSEAIANLVTISGNINSDLANIKAALTLGLKKQYDAQQQAIAPATYYNEAKTYTGCWVVTYATDANNVPTNETLKNYTITVTNKDFIIGKAGFTMMAIGGEKEYNAQALTAADFSYVAYAGTSAVEIPEGVTVTYEVLDETGEEPTWTTTFPTNVGVYTYRVKANTAYAPSDYDGNNIQCPTATFEIKKKTIKISVDNVTLHVGDDAAILNKYATFQTKTNGFKPFGNDKLSVVFSFAEAVTTSDTYYDATTKKLKAATENPINNAITVRLATEDDDVDLLQNGNYEIAEGGVTLGKLTIVPGVIVTCDVTDADIADLYEDLDGEEGINVRFKNTQYTIPAGEWRTLVLPFDITPLEFCNMLGVQQYAIFNKLTSANAETNVVRFSLEQELLPANTPFLVKAPKKIVLDDVEFVGRDFDYEETPTAIVPQAKFIGSYVDVLNIEGGANKMWWSNSEKNFVKATKGGQPKSFPNYCFHAYLHLDESFAPDADVRIYVEEADGTVTAINSINADGIAVPAEGWYNLNGVKLEGVPTEKGVYINNGKKVVIK